MVATVAVMIKRFAFFMLCVCATVSATAIPARVDYVIDGDTFSCVVKLDGGVDVSARIRIRNVDTPEIRGDCEYERNMAMRARTRLSEMLPAGSMVELTNIKDDKYLGRIDANVTDSHGDDIGNKLVREGLGRKYNGGRREKWCK
jgi:endonuclease YncB( thermonuclease family)